MKQNPILAWVTDTPATGGDAVPMFAHYDITHEAEEGREEYPAIKAGQLVEVAGDRAVQPASDRSQRVCGVAGEDIVCGGAGLVAYSGAHAVIAAENIEAGDRVEAAEGGRVQPGTSRAVGIALSSGEAGDSIDVLITL